MLKNVIASILPVAVMFASSTLQADPTDPATEAIKSAIRKSIPLLEKGSAGSAEQRKCFTCHNQGVPVLALVEARRRGFPVDEDNLHVQLKHTAASLNRRKSKLLEGRGKTIIEGYALWTLEVGGWNPDETTAAATGFLLENQKKASHWRNPGNRPPSVGSDFTTTYVALRGLTAFGTKEQQATIDARRKAVRQWLLGETPRDTEDRVFRLRALEYVDADDRTVSKATAELIDSRRSDGGWAQTSDTKSDAYATGTVLVALLRAGDVRADHPAVRRGVQYLLDTQLEDGSWRVVSRAKPFQTYFESGFPHGKDQFISIAGSSWATLALLLALPERRQAGGDGSESEPLRAGIIGLDTSHVIAFTRILNDPKATGELAGVKVVAGYPGGTDIPASKNRVKGFTERLRGMGVEIVDSIPALLEKVDVVLLESVDGRPHLEQVLPVLRAGKPVFVDKPVAGSLKDAVAIYEAAKLYDVPVFSSSSTRFQEGPQAIRGGKIGDVLGCDAYGPGSLQEHHPDLFWYGIHTVEALFTCMGAGCETVTRVAAPRFDVVVGTWKGGRIGSYRGIRRGKVQSGGTAFGTEAIMPYSRGSGGYRPLVVEIARFFRTGKPPVSPEETLEIYAFMEAADESKRQGGAPVSIESVLAKARVASAWKGRWDGGGEHGGELKCLARHVSGEDWEATFTGTCNGKFAYEVVMKGRKTGDTIVFTGEADLGDKDGGLYQWSGEIDGDTFAGRYSSDKGKKGAFKMGRLNTGDLKQR